eukprot:519424-Pelagomonas_calceolata.AAC.1
MYHQRLISQTRGLSLLVDPYMPFRLEKAVLSRELKHLSSYPAHPGDKMTAGRLKKNYFRGCRKAQERRK